MTADNLREKFLDFFASKKHKIIESDSLVPRDDPTVLFTPAGMNQFKKEFLGFDSGFKRAVTSQRCLRTDDLEKVGKTSCHHTFFEMLGNFSFGDYFKREAISWAWEFLTQELKLNPVNLWVSVYKDDDEAYSIWKDKIGLSPEKIIKLGDKENFWPSEAKQKGPNGPCGPCSEIFFDYGPAVGCKKPNCNPACGCSRFTEVWNLVFTQFNRKDSGALEPLPNKNIDTGMGLERLTAVIEGVDSNFETGLFQPLIKEIRNRLEPGKENYGLICAVADHVRAVVFSIYDGILPSNEARGYVVRKLIRKSVLALRSLGIREPLLSRLVPVLAAVMQKPYPHLQERQENIAQIILSEEKNFINTLNSSASLFKEKFGRLGKKPDPQLAGKTAFQLYDTYGIPLELSKEWLKDKGIGFCEKAFEHELSQQKNRSKAHSLMRGDVFAAADIKLGLKQTGFEGYKSCSTRAKILKIIRGDSEIKKATQADGEIKVILDKTAFYPESGGQIGDTGQIIKGRNIFEVLDTRKTGKAIIHIGSVKAAGLKKGDSVLAKVDTQRRLSIGRNHTATHLLQAALRKVLGTHVQQQGSLVAPDRLRFDFTHFKDISSDELDRIEEVVNGFILGNYALTVKQMPLSEAKKKGYLAFFGEKYESRVRVVGIGDISGELCGGTHLGSTGQIGLFKIIHEGSIASGIRRIEAVTGNFAYKAAKEERNLLNEVAQILKVPQDKLVPELEKRIAQAKALEKQLTSQRIDSTKQALDSFIQEAETIKEVKVIAREMQNSAMDLLRKAVDLIKEKASNSVIALASSSGEKAFLVVGVTADLVEKGFDASKLILDMANIIGGSGGGRKDFAQAGGTRPENFAQAFKALKEAVANSQP